MNVCSEINYTVHKMIFQVKNNAKEGLARILSESVKYSGCNACLIL